MASSIAVIKICKISPSVASPRYETAGAAGMDIRAFLAEPVVLQPLERTRIPTGFALEMPENCEAQVRPRSGLAYKQGVTVLNAPGTIDSDYRGEVRVILVNLGREPVVINNGDRIAQLVFAPVMRVALQEASCLPETERGGGGFGSTGR
ncbi:MAG: dUTP diphosphatase [Treponema sp.]|jgi:dUTP pyrophosphatase|nr:dUTP diphosphatase [Treponema sp.]